MTIKLYSASNHNKDDKQKLNRQQVCNNLKRKSIDNPFEKPCKILRRELLKGDISTWTTNDTTLVRKNLHYARSSIYPKLPDTLIELHTALDNMNIKANRNEDFFYLLIITKKIL